MNKTGLADSPLFLSPHKKNEGTAPLSIKTVNKIEKREKIKTPKKKISDKPGKRDTTAPRHHDTTVSRYQDAMPPRVHGVMIESIRKAVKEFGKEAATHRFTGIEKKEIADLIYTYKNIGIKTSENEITRIAVNFIMEDYKENGENSVLNKILEALNK